MLKKIRNWVGDVAAGLCHITNERLAFALHPVIEWGWMFNDDDSSR